MPKVEISVPKGAKRLNKLPEIERNAFLAGAYLSQNNKVVDYQQFQKVYELFAGEPITKDELHTALKHVEATYIDYRETEFDQSVMEDVQLGITMDGEMCLAGQYTFPIQELAKVIFSPAIKREGKIIKTFGPFEFEEFLKGELELEDKDELVDAIEFNPCSKRTLVSLFENQEDITFWRITYQEEGDISIDDFFEMLTRERMNKWLNED